MKSVPRYELLSIPAFTEAPFCQDKSIMTRLCIALGFSLVMKGDE